MKILILLRKAASRLLGAVLVPSTRTSPTSYLGDSFFDCQRRPKKADEFSCNRHDDFVVLFASTGHAPIAPAQPASQKSKNFPLLGNAIAFLGLDERWIQAASWRGHARRHVHPKTAPGVTRLAAGAAGSRQSPLDAAAVGRE